MTCLSSKLAITISKNEVEETTSDDVTVCLDCLSCMIVSASNQVSRFFLFYESNVVRMLKSINSMLCYIIPYFGICINRKVYERDIKYTALHN